MPSAPFRYRVVTPILAWLLPTSRLVGFAVVNVSALIAAGTVSYAYLRDLGFGVRRAAFGLALFVISPAVAYLSTNLVLVDGVTMFMLACVFWAAYRDRLLVFAALLALGVATKESVLFALPIYGLYCLQRRGIRGVVRPIVAAIPAGLMYVGLRVFYGFSDDTLSAIIARGVGAQLDKLAMSVFYIPYEVYSAFGTLWVLAALYGVVTLPKVARSGRVDRQTAFLAAGIAVVPLAFLQPLIARNITRVLFIAFPNRDPDRAARHRPPLTSATARLLWVRGPGGVRGRRGCARRAPRARRQRRVGVAPGHPVPRAGRRGERTRGDPRGVVRRWVVDRRAPDVVVVPALDRSAFDLSPTCSALDSSISKDAYWRLS